jgi:M-phase inducer tyrosine phosphatase
MPAPRLAVPQSPAGFSVPSLGGSPDLGSFFCESPVAPAAVQPAKRRSLVASSPASPSSSPSAKRSALGLHRSSVLDKTQSSGAMLFGAPRPGNLASRRAQPYKRPPLAAVTTSESTRSASTNSAYPILYGQTRAGAPLSAVSAAPMMAYPAPVPMRRAYSVCDQPVVPEMSEDESEFEVSPSMAGTHAEYARRHQSRVVPRVDGSPGFRPQRSSIAATGEGVASPVANKAKRTSPYGPGGLPGFGDNEMDGKILPCRKVKEDGLVRITSETVCDLLDEGCQADDDSSIN